MTNHEIHEPIDFNEVLRKLQTSDPAHADTFNPLFERLINNDVFLKNLTERLIQEHTHSGKNGEGSKIPLDNIDVPTGLGDILTAKELAEHVNERNPHGTRAVDVGGASAQEFTTHLAEDASTTKKGHVQLNNTTTSTSTTQAATANAVRSAYNRAVDVDSEQVNRLTANTHQEDSTLADYPMGFSVMMAANSINPWSVLSGSEYGVVETYRTSPGWGTQRITCHRGTGTRAVYQRSIGSNTVGAAWGPWKQILTQDGGDLTGILKAHPNTSYTVPQVRNIRFGTTEPTGAIGSNGDIYFQYEE